MDSFKNSAHDGRFFMGVRYIPLSTYTSSADHTHDSTCVHDSIGKHFSLTALRFVESKLTVFAYSK